MSRRSSRADVRARGRHVINTRGCFRADGQPKARLDLRTATERARDGLGEAYRCEVCDGWHVGTRKKK